MDLDWFLSNQIMQNIYWIHSQSSKINFYEMCYLVNKKNYNAHVCFMYCDMISSFFVFQKVHRSCLKKKMKHLFKYYNIKRRERWQRHKNWHDFIAFFQPIYLHNISLVTIHGKDFFMTLVQYGGQIIGYSKAEYSSASFTIRKALVNSSHSSDEKLLTIIYLLYVVVSLERF